MNTLVLLVAFFHSFYFSIAEVNFNAASESIEVSLKMFTDDLSDAIDNESTQKMHLNTEREHEAAERYIKMYVEKYFKVDVNEVEIPISYLGKEYEDDSTWCYFEIKGVKPDADVAFYNRVLIDKFEKQKNVLYYKKQGKRKTLMFSRGDYKKTVNFF